MGLGGPWLQSVLRGGIACIGGLPVASRGPADEWMLSLEPFSTRSAGHPLSRVCLAKRSAYGLSAMTFRRAGSYTSSCFHIDSTMAAMRRASVSLARLGLMPASSRRR